MDRLTASKARARVRARAFTLCLAATAIACAGLAQLGSAPAHAATMTSTFTSAGGNTTIPDVGPANTFPKTVTVSGHHQYVESVRIGLANLDHDYPGDLIIVVKSPSGSTVSLYSENCGSSPITDLDLVFDDSGPLLPWDSSCVDGTYRPAGSATPAFNDATAPAGPFESMLGTFKNENPNGTWEIWIEDLWDPDGGRFGTFSVEMTSSDAPVTAPELTIPDAGPAETYPITTTVSGLSGPIADLDVIAPLLSHTWAEDVDMILQSPSGTAVTLLSDACADSVLLDVQFRFDDEAAGPPGATTNENCASGSVQTADYQGFDVLPDPAPMATGALLSAFDGEDPNGEWKLYVADDAGTAGGLIGSSFTLDVTVGEIDTQIAFGPPSLHGEATAFFGFAGVPDNASGYECKLDAGEYEPCVSPLQLESLTEGAHVFQVRALGSAGADSSPAESTFTVDTLAPETAIDSYAGDLGLTNNAAPEFTFSADEDATFECSLVAGAAAGLDFAACSGPTTHAPGLLADGTYTFAVAATDALGHTDPTPAVDTFEVDTAAPALVVDGPADGSTVDAGAAFSFEADEAATFECGFDGNEFASCTSPVSLSVLTTGAHTFAVRATDAAGNTGAAVERSFTTVSLPDTQITSNSGDLVATTDPQPGFSFVATGGPAGTFECAITQGAVEQVQFEACSGEGLVHVPAEPLADGEYSFHVRAIGVSGSPDPTPAVDDFVIDRTGPVITLDGPADGATVTTSSVTFEITADEPAEFVCRIDGGPFSDCVSPLTRTNLLNGTYSLTVRGYDALGNESASVSRSFTVAAPVPDTSIDGDLGATTDRSPAFTFSASGAEADGFECALTSGAATDADFGECSGDGVHAVAGDLADGQYVFSVRAVDTAGNVDATPASDSFVVDTTGPVVSITGGPAQGSVVAAATATFTFGANEPATFSCSADGGAFAACGSPASFSGLVNGPHSFAVVAADPLGNTGATVSRSFSVDVPPAPGPVGEGTAAPTPAPVTEPAPPAGPCDGKSGRALRRCKAEQKCKKIKNKKKRAACIKKARRKR